MAIGIVLISIIGLMLIISIISIIYDFAKFIKICRIKSNIVKNIKPDDTFYYTWSKDFNNPFETIFVDVYKIIDVKKNDNNETYVKYKLQTISEDGLIVAGKDDDDPIIHTDNATDLIDRIYTDETNEKLNEKNI